MSGQNRRAKAHKRFTTIPKLSNNALKHNPMYGAMRKEIDRMQPIFNDLNTLDLELYEYARQISKEFFDLRVTNDGDFDCKISTEQSSLSNILREEKNSDKKQFMIHIHGWPHTGESS